MNEIIKKEVIEGVKNSDKGFKEIKPENGMTKNKADNFFNKVLDKFSEIVKPFSDKHETNFGGKYNSYETRISCTPLDDSQFGKYTGARGESKFIPSDTTPEGIACKKKLAEYGKKGIDYINAEPDFSECSEATVVIDNMTQNRENYWSVDGKLNLGNFSQADKKCAELWNSQQRDKKSNWTARDVAKYRKANNLSWHERCDTKTMDLVPFDIHSFFKHLGGVSECKIRDSKDGNGGTKFDE